MPTAGLKEMTDPGSRMQCSVCKREWWSKVEGYECPNCKPLQNAFMRGGMPPERIAAHRKIANDCAQCETFRLTECLDEIERLKAAPALTESKGVGVRTGQ